MMKKNTSWFTLIELIVSVSILSIIMISVFMIFALSSDLNNKTDISRAMQENIKNIVETIAEDVRKQGKNLKISSSNGLWTCQNPEKIYASGTTLCVGNDSYYIAKQEANEWIKVSNYENCDIKTQCFLVKNTGTAVTQLSNSWVDFKSLVFYVARDGVNKVTIHFEIQPSSKKWIKPELIQENRMILQTTLSERLYNDY